MKINKLNNIQFGTLVFFLINSFFINFGLSYLTNINKNDAIIDIIIGGVFIILFLFIILWIRKQYNYNLIEIISTFSILKYPLFFILITCLVLASIFSLNNLTSFINYYILNSSNYFTISLTLIATIIYLTSKNLNTISRISEIVFYIYILLFILGSFGLYKYIDLSNLKPLLTSNINKHVTASFTFFSNSILPLFLILGLKNNKKDNHTLIIFTLLSIFIIFIQTVIIISVLGINLANIYIYPDIIIYKKISFFNILERVEVLLAFNQLLNGLFILTLNFYLIKEIINVFFKKKKELTLLTLLGTFFLLISNSIRFDESIYIFINSSLIIIVLIFLIKILIYKYILHLEDQF